MQRGSPLVHVMQVRVAYVLLVSSLSREDGFPNLTAVHRKVRSPMPIISSRTQGLARNARKSLLRTRRRVSRGLHNLKGPARCDLLEDGRREGGELGGS